MARIPLVLTLAPVSAGCERTLTGSPGPVRAIAASLTGGSACSSVSGTLLLRFVGSDGTHLFFEGDIQGDLEGTLSETIEVVPPTASLPTVVHVSGSSQWAIGGGSVPELIGRVVAFSVTGVGVDAGALGHAFHSTVVAGARSGDIVQQEPQPGFFPYHGDICP